MKRCKHIARKEDEVVQRRGSPTKSTGRIKAVGLKLRETSVVVFAPGCALLLALAVRDSKEDRESKPWLGKQLSLILG